MESCDDQEKELIKQERKDLTVENIIAQLEKRLTPIEAVEYRQILMAKTLEDIISSHRIRPRNLDVMGVPIRELDMTDQWEVLGRMPYEVTLILTAEEFGVDQEVVKRAERSYEIGLQVLRETRPDLPYERLEDFLVKAGKCIVAYWHEFKELSSKGEYGESEDLFCEYVRAHAKGDPHSFRDALCELFRLWSGRDSEFEQAEFDGHIADLTPVERVEYWNMRSEEELSELDNGAGGSVAEDPILRGRYFGYVVSEFAILKRMKILEKKYSPADIAKGEQRIDRMYDEFFSDLERVNDDVKNNLFSRGAYFGEKAATLDFGNLMYYREAGDEASDELSPIYNFYLMANTVGERPENFREMFCTMCMLCE